MVVSRIVDERPGDRVLDLASFADRPGETIEAPPGLVDEVRRANARRGRRRGIRVQLFAGGGGASEGERDATGESPDVAINHWPVAIAIHRANHPETTHHIADVFEVDPLVATGGAPVDFLWMSPTCTHFSPAKGRALLEDKLRAQAWVIRPWIEKCRPDVIVLENVKQFETWGPLIEKHAPGCPGSAGGEGCLRGCRYGCPDKERAGETFAEWHDWIVAQGYSFEARVIVAWEYGAPTTRERLYIVMRADGRPARWPRPTHAPEPTAERPHRWRTAAEIIDWSLPCRSIFGRKKSLAEASLRRLVRGVGKFVLSPEATPFCVRGDNGGADAAFLAKHYGERRSGEVMAQALDRPLGTVTAQDHHALALASLVKFYGTSTGAPLDRPLGVVTAQGWKHGLSLAFLSRYNGCSVGQAIERPIGTLETRDRYSLVSADLAPADETPLPPHAHDVYDLMVRHGYTGPGLDHERRLVLVAVGGITHVIGDLAMRMLAPRELFRAQGFPDAYVIAPVGPRGRALSGRDQIRACGNSVCPPVARAIVRAALELGPDPEGDADLPMAA